MMTWLYVIAVYLAVAFITFCGLSLASYANPSKTTTFGWRALRIALWPIVLLGAILRFIGAG